VPVPSIHSFSTMPHGFRGICSNCHEIAVGNARPVAQTQMVPQGISQFQQMMPQAQAAPQAAMPSAPMMPQMAQPGFVQPGFGPQMMMPGFVAPQMMVPGYVTPQFMAPQGMPGQVMPQQGMPQAFGPSPFFGNQTPMAQAAPGPPMGIGQLPQRMPNEAEWRGLEVRNAAAGVMVTNIDGTAARMGVQIGDQVRSINGQPIDNTATFVQATQNGNLQQGTLVVDRGNERLAFELARAPDNVQQVPNMAAGMNNAPGAPGL
jgi:hypothetical protein